MYSFMLESGTHRLSRRAASHAESWLPGRPGSRVAGNRGGERLKRGGGRGLAKWTLIVHRGSNSSVIPRSLPLWLICTSSLLRALAKPCRASAAAPAHRRSPRGTARRRTETEDEGVGALLYKGAPTGYTPGRAVEQKAYFLHGHALQCNKKYEDGNRDAALDLARSTEALAPPASPPRRKPRVQSRKR